MHFLEAEASTPGTSPNQVVHMDISESSEETPFPFARLPIEIQCQVFDMLDPPMQRLCRLVCHDWSKCLKQGFGKLTDNPNTLELLKHATFSEIVTLVVENFSKSELPRHEITDLISPVLARRLELDGALNLPQSVVAVLDQYSEAVIELSLKLFCFADILTPTDSDTSVPGPMTFKSFNNLKVLSFHMVKPLIEQHQFKVAQKNSALTTHMNNWIEFFTSEIPTLQTVTGALEKSRLNKQHRYTKLGYDPGFVELLPRFCEKFGAFVRRHRTGINKLYFKEEFSGDEFFKRYGGEQDVAMLLFGLKQLEISIDTTNEDTSDRIINGYGTPMNELQRFLGSRVGGNHEEQLKLFFLWLTTIQDTTPIGWVRYLSVILEWNQCLQYLEDQAEDFPAKLKISLGILDVEMSNGQPF